jgi:hypothetical protein
MGCVAKTSGLKRALSPQPQPAAIMLRSYALTLPVVGTPDQSKSFPQVRDMMKAIMGKVAPEGLDA